MTDEKPTSLLYSGRFVSLRDERHNPHNGAHCALHLRRVCGVCPHFEGSLRGGPAGCAKLGLTPRPDASARRCEYWSRRGSA